MNTGNAVGTKSRGATALFVVGSLFFLYAFLGNYTTLPGYLRFLERGGTAAGSATVDTSMVVGAVKTILWMFSFQLGVYFSLLAVLVRVAPKRNAVAVVATLGACWFGVAGIPKLPGPYAAFFAISGFLILGLIVLVLVFWMRRARGFSLASLHRLIGYVFFALASWDVCGLGTAGRILHLDMAIQAGTQSLLVTQTSKIALEFLLAWGFTLAGYVRHDRATHEERT